jgi:hypothetical protein
MERDSERRRSSRVDEPQRRVLKRFFARVRRSAHLFRSPGKKLVFGILAGGIDFFWALTERIKALN